MVMDESDVSDRLISDNSTQLSKDIHSLVVKYVKRVRRYSLSLSLSPTPTPRTGTTIRTHNVWPNSKVRWRIFKLHWVQLSPCWCFEVTSWMIFWTMRSSLQRNPLKFKHWHVMFTWWCFGDIGSGFVWFSWVWPFLSVSLLPLHVVPVEIVEKEKVVWYVSRYSQI